MTVPMLVSRKRSHSDLDSVDIQLPIQIHSRPPTPVDESYDWHVLRLDFGRTEAELDQQYRITALNLGIALPPEPKESLDAVTNESALTVSSVRTPSSSAPSGTSDSIQLMSWDTNEQHFRMSDLSSQNLSPATTAPSSVASIASLADSPYNKIRKGLRRLSTYARRRTLSAAYPTVATSSLAAAGVLKSRLDPTTFEASSWPELVGPAPRKAIAQSLSSMHGSQPVSRSHTPVNEVDEEDPEEEEEEEEEQMEQEEEGETEDTRIGCQRSLDDPRLQKLRRQQMEEQDRFVQYEQDQQHRLEEKKLEARNRIAEYYQNQQERLRERHAEAITDLENRHLTAEIDLVRTLKAERQACETRLKHMEAYCNAQTTGMPQRRVTQDDRRKLAQQYHLRESMDNLHKARVNVLRERQAKQLERITAKQEAQFTAEIMDMNQELTDADRHFSSEALEHLEQVEERKTRIISRWALMEAIERKRLELEIGEAFGPLPTITWPLVMFDERMAVP